MTVLYLNFLVLCILATWQALTPNILVKKNIYLIMCGQLLLLAMLRRTDVGADTSTYVQIFTSLLDVPWSQCFDWMGFEPGYLLLNKLIGLFTSNPQIFLVVMSLIIYLPFFLFFYRSSSFSGFCLVSFVAIDMYAFGYGIFRQSCAIVIILWAYKFIVKQNFWKFIILVLLASTFHQTALICIPFYFLYKFEIKASLVCSCGFLSFLLFVFGESFLKLFQIWTRKYYIFNYTEGRNWFVLLWILIIVFYCTAKRKLADSNFKLLYIGLLLTGTFQSFSMIMEAFSRATYYFQICLLLLLPDALKGFFFSKKNSKYKLFGCVLFCSILFIYYWWITNNGLGYYFLWE